MQFLLLTTSAAAALMASLAAIPVIIHLINMMRHRRVKWAAMEFLLQSYKKQRNWIFFKQLLLLLLRMAVMVTAVAMLARLDTAGQLTAIFGGKTTHHYVLLDDSFSMADQGGGLSAFERAKDVVARIGRRAGDEPTRQRMTLIRFSRATLGAPVSAEQAVADTRIDLGAEIIDTEFDASLEEKRRTFEVTELAVGPQAALQMVERLATEMTGERAHLYLISDFRAGDWRNPAEVRKTLQGLQKAGVEMHLVRCVTGQQPNLAITALAAADQTRAAGVPLFAELTVKNFGPTLVKKVPVKIESLFFDRELEKTAANAGKVKPFGEDLPAVLIDRIEPGESVTRRVQVYFKAAGQHVLRATLPDDAVRADNHRQCVIDLPEAVPLLLIDDRPEVRNDAYYLRSVFDPGPRARTGLRAETQTSAFLRDSTLDTLRSFHSIYLLNVPRLDDVAVDHLQRYVEGGGGLAVFLGPDSNIKFYNQLYEQADGLFPAPLTRDDLLPPAADAEVPDLRGYEHPVFQFLAGESNVYLRGVTIERYFRTSDDFAPDPQSSTKIIGRLRTRDPLVVIKQLGKGRVVAVLTTASPLWNSWARDDSFGLFILNLQSYLAAPARADQKLLVGGPIDLELDSTVFRPELSFYVPSLTAGGRQRIVRNAVPPKEDSPLLETSIGRAEGGTSRSGETDRSGIYEAWPLTKKNEPQVRRYTLNVDPQEGNLAVMEPRGLAAALAPVEIHLQQAEEYEYETARQAGSNWTNLLLMVLIGVLLLEQALAYSASYHPARGAAP